MPPLICWLSGLLVEQQKKNPTKKQKTKYSFITRLQVSTFFTPFILQGSAVRTHLLERNAHVWVRNGPQFDMAAPPPTQQQRQQQKQQHPCWKTLYQSSVNSTSLSCLLIIQSSPPRCRCHGWGWPRSATIISTFFFFLSLSPISPPSFLSLSFKDWAFFFEKE